MCPDDESAMIRDAVSWTRIMFYAKTFRIIYRRTRQRDLRTLPDSVNVGPKRGLVRSG